MGQVHIQIANENIANTLQQSSALCMAGLLFVNRGEVDM